MNTAEESNRLLHNSPVFADVNRLWNGTPDRLPIGTEFQITSSLSSSTSDAVSGGQRSDTLLI